MKPDIHPPYRAVLFVDATTGATFLTRSTVSTTETATWTDGRTYPVKRVDVSASSHPFWTGTQRVIDSAGRIERFRRKYAR